MNCSEFRRCYQSLLDEGGAELLPREMSDHMTKCPGCLSLATALRGVDHALRVQQRLPISEAFVRDLTAIPLKSLLAEFSRKRTLARGLAMTLPVAAVLMLGMSCLPPAQFFWMRLSLTTAGLTYFWVKVLRQRRLAVSLE